MYIYVYIYYRIMLSVILTVLAACSLVAAGPLTTCTSDQFACQNGDCINGTLKCDGVKNCADGSDEIFNTCYNTTCAQDFFRCNYGGCVAKQLTCDGGNDCWDKSDENKFLCADALDMEKLLHELKGSCSNHALQCKENGSCLKWSQLCDGHRDCPTGDDESPDVCGASICPTGSFRCETGSCINGNGFCNRNIDCPDGSDEIPDVCLKEKPTSPEILAPTGAEHAAAPSVWKTNSCPLKTEKGMRVEDYFSEFTFRPDGEVPDKTIVSLTCESGYALFGTNINKCENGKWLNVMEFLPHVCIRVCDQSPIERNISYATQCVSNYAVVDCKQDALMKDTKLLVTCGPGFRAKSSANQLGRHSCNENGEWFVEEPNPICEPVCGVKSSQHPDITPWSVTIFQRRSGIEPNYNFRCLGTVLSPYIVITAADYFSDMNARDAHIYYTIVEGNHIVDFNLNEDHGYSLHNILNIHLVTFNMAQKAALLTLVKPFRLGALVRPICLTASQADVADRSVEIVSPGDFSMQQLGEGQTVYENGKYTLTHFVASESSKYNIQAFISAIKNEISKTEQSP